MATIIIEATTTTTATTTATVTTVTRDETIVGNIIRKRKAGVQVMMRETILHLVE